MVTKKKGRKAGGGKTSRKGKLLHLKGDDKPEGTLPEIPDDEHALLAELKDTYCRLAKVEAEIDAWKGKAKIAHERKLQIERELRHLLRGQRVLPFEDPPAGPKGDTDVDDEPQELSIESGPYAEKNPPSTNGELSGKDKAAGEREEKGEELEPVN